MKKKKPDNPRTDPSPAGALHQQPEWCRVTLASIGDAVITTDDQGRVTFLNPVAESLTGWPLSQAEGQPLDAVFQIVNEETRRTVESPTLRALQEGVVVGLANHTLLIAKDGTVRPIDDSAAPIRNAEGEVAGVVLVFRDITERKRQEAIVKDAIAYGENVIATLREPFLVLDRGLRVVSANRAFYRTFLVTPDETVGRFVYDLGNRQWDIPGLRTLLEELLPLNHAFHDFEVDHEFPDLGRRTMVLDARRIPDPADGSELILLAIEDVTERRRASAALEDSEVRYRRLFETAQDAILILDADSGEIRDANPFIQQMLGYSLDDFLGRQLWELGMFEDKEAIRSAFRRLQDEGYIRFDHLPLRARGGQKVEVEFVSNVYEVDHKSVIQCNIRDITERSRLERTTQDLAQALADLHRRKDEFLAMLSHELRNPLAPIANAVLLLRLHQEAGPIQQQARGIIERQVMQLTRLVDDLLEVSRITTGRIQLHQERVALNGVVEHAIEGVRPLIEQRKHVLTVSLPPHPLWLYADAARLEQVMVNLLRNAAKYTNEGGTIHVAVEPDGEDAVVRVLDTGVGISAELLPRIFELFTQAERSLDRSQGGLGIGLALVHRLVEMHGGRVEAYSALGKGSEFVVRLPLLPSDEESASSIQAETTRPAGSSLRILVVDDSADSTRSLGMLLTSWGHDVREAQDGPSALDIARDFQPDVVLLDIGLPRMDGYEVVKAMHREPVLASVVTVALTGYGQEADRKHSLEAGFDHHLVKPVDFAELQGILTTAATP